MIFGNFVKPTPPPKRCIFAFFPTYLEDGRYAWLKYVWRTADVVHRDTPWAYFETKEDSELYDNDSQHFDKHC